MNSNGQQIVLGLVAAAAYSAAFHHIKDFAKRRTEKHRCPFQLKHNFVFKRACAMLMIFVLC